MEASGRQPRKNKRVADRPFYEKTGTTSADIVAEARSAVRSLQTRRPCTPTDSKRTLFGNSATRPVEGRPPSVLSGNFQYEESSSRPPSGRARLTPLENAPEIPEEVFIPGPPSTPPSSKVRRPIRTSLPSNGDTNTSQPLTGQVPTIASGTPSISPKTNAKIKSAVAGSDGPIVFCPSPPKKVLSSNTPPSSASIARRNSAGPTPTPTPPSAIKADLLVTRRVRSGPKERSSPLSPEECAAENQELNKKLNYNGNGTRSEESSPKKDVNHTERASSGDKRKRKPGSESDKTKDELALYYEEQVKPLLVQMEDKFSANNTGELCRDCLKLWNLLERKGMMGKASGSSSARRRGEILKTLFKFLDVTDPRLMLRLGKLILSMKVSGNNITNICMVIYKLAKTEKNDQMFLEEDMLRYLVDALKGYDTLTYREALVYTTGALKHLSNNNPATQQELMSLGTIEALANLLNTICNDIPQYGKPEWHISNLLVQITGVLRYIADVNGARELFLSLNIIKYLGDLLHHFSTDEDLVYNTSRILSKLTLYNDCCTQLCSSENCFRALLKALKDHDKKQEVVVRICFILGNLTAKNDEARSQLFNTKSCMMILLSLMKMYSSMEQSIKSESSDSSKSHSDYSSGSESSYSKNEPLDDVLVKIIRVIANLSINMDVGSVIAANEDCINILLQILDTKSIETNEELVLNTVATLNNLSFYQDSSSVVLQRQVDITESLLGLLLPENMDAMVEASRVFGNLTRSKDVRKVLAEHKVDEIMIALLDAGERETVFTACGVLINLMTDDDRRPKLREEGGIKKLIDVLHDFGKNDWQLSAMVCQTLWNFSGDITTSFDTFGEEETLDLIDVLTEYLDEEVIFSSSMEEMDPSLYDTLRDMWDQVFYPVGYNLLHRIKTHHTDLVPLESPS
ncbi:armadillo repeat-containing protein 2-like [Actinia tenebrosa]|uniref:Armadillo repeat-containing protein 2-like n=1 Tax=Actinia tenebrosa TaxID=6105 RepID=A0A6P8HBV7_ACTTE|nr:armadillo repeat-containing protein 2-like [Actinia tenebrosa]